MQSGCPAATRNCIWPRWPVHSTAAPACTPVAAGKPLYAECGGMLYLLDSLTDKQGQSGQMLGLLPGHARLNTRLSALGLQQLQLDGAVLRGHTFHYSSLDTPITPLTHASRATGSGQGEPVYRHGSLLASYLHLYFPSNPAACARLFLP
jgi:cobyrinic acid a,c-diamide synthase